MQSLWNDIEAHDFIANAPNIPPDLALRVYTSRLLGRDQSLVLHGGGNTSVKIPRINRFGREEDILYVKGSGWDLETIQPQGFSPCLMSYLLELATLDELSDVEMANQLRCSMIDASAPSPSVEAILHAILPYNFVDHTHADATIALMNNPHGREIISEVYGDELVFIPYVMPGFKLARVCAEEFPQQVNAKTQGMILFNHGIFTFADDARESYELMIKFVALAEDYLARHTVPVPDIPTHTNTKLRRAELAAFRQQISQAAGFPMIMISHNDEQVMRYVGRDDLAEIALQGPLTPDHIIRTKRLPLIGRDVAAFVESYRAYFDEHAARSDTPLTMVDPAPRIILDPDWGMLTIGRTVKDARIAEDVYRHTIDVIQQAVSLGGYQALPASDLFDIEYWDLEQAKLRAAGKPAPFAGEIALVTGAASGIGKACVESLLARGAAVVALDINPAVESLFKRPEVLSIPCDITDESRLVDALEQTALRFGGLDMIVLNAGIFPSGTPISNLTLAEWDKVMRVNLDANLSLLREAHPMLKAAPRGGKVVVIASKNVPAPGPGAAAYSASKAALTQLARVAALEWGGDGIRVNVVHPNAVFDTGLWTEEVLANRAAHYGLSVDEYKTNNILKVEVTSHDVAELVADLCSATFSRTTGAQIPIDGGNDRVI
jgi:rhamnose utilization protein RhaD (predicted bifunctional aldolase and dehydrogenase)/NAD(P)-dependent dehydrogenase (short-subunit alcohol dehydrogenase family)